MSGRWFNMDDGIDYNDRATVLDVVTTPPTSTTQLYSVTSSDLGVYIDSEWLTITREIPNGGYHNLTFTVENGGNNSPYNASQLLVYSVVIVRDSV